MAVERSAAYYRQRAREMRKMANGAQTQAMQASYFAIAQNWDRLADEAEPAEPEEQG